MANYFEVLNGVNVNDKTESKNGLTYLSWAYAWGEVKKRFPTANYTIYENCDGWNYHTDGRTAWVKTGVTVEGVEHIEELPVMDFKNKSIPLENVTSYDVNKAIQRSLTKACARHGLGLYIYAGEDLPEGEEPEVHVAQKTSEQRAQKTEVKVVESGRKLTIRMHQQASGIPSEEIRRFMGALNATSFDELTERQFDDLLKMVKAYKPPKD